MPPLELIRLEQQRALAIIRSSNRQVWNLASNRQRQYLQIIDHLFNSQGHQLRIVPELSIHNSPALDIGGVFRAKINEVFQFLLHSDIFTFDNTIEKTTFTLFSALQYQYRHKQYLAFGQIFYWFVIIHRHIPFPDSLNPAILAYGIHGYIPTNVIQQVDEVTADVVEIIKSYTTRTPEDRISDDVKNWLTAKSVNINDFMSDLRTNGPQYLAETTGTMAIVGDCLSAFMFFREGFTKNRGFTSVYYFNSFN